MNHHNDPVIPDQFWIGRSFSVTVGDREYSGLDFWEAYTRSLGVFVRREEARVVYKGPLDLSRLSDNEGASRD